MKEFKTYFQNKIGNSVKFRQNPKLFFSASKTYEPKILGVYGSHFLAQMNGYTECFMYSDFLDETYQILDKNKREYSM